MMRCLRLSSLLLVLLSACSSPYKNLQKTTGNIAGSALAFRPEFKKAIYRAHVDGRFLFKKFHLSGILFFKNFEDGSTRVVFQNEMGFAFFDFSWDKHDSFAVKSILPQLDKPAVVKTLRKDIELLLMRSIARNEQEIFTKDATIYYRFPLTSGHAYYIAKASGQGKEGLLRIEAANKRPVTTIYPIGKPNNAAMPDSISILHHKAHFTINAKTIQDAAAE